MYEININIIIIYSEICTDNYISYVYDYTRDTYILYKCTSILYVNVMKRFYFDYLFFIILYNGPILKR